MERDPRLPARQAACSFGLIHCVDSPNHIQFHFAFFVNLGVDSMSSFLTMYRSFLGTSTSSTSGENPPAKQTAALLKPLKARLANDVPGVCPFCQAAMSKSTAAGAEVYVCHHDKYVAPVPNSELAPE